jgi:hypothetical protein
VQEVTLGLAVLVTDHEPVDLLSETAFPTLTPPNAYAWAHTGISDCCAPRSSSFAVAVPLSFGGF